MSRPRTPPIHGFAIDDENREKLEAHGISARQVLQLLDNKHEVVRNRRKRRAQFLVLGHDHGGACICVPIEATADPAIWRPVTAWYCKEHESQFLRNQLGKRRRS
jgi:uncharacterized DUF497 family protein